MASSGSGEKVARPPEQLGRLGGGQRQVLELAERIDVILRRLDRNRIGHAVGRAQPVGRRRLGAARQRRLDAGRGVVFRQPDDAGEFAVEVDLERGVLERFLDARIGDARNMAYLRQQLVGEGAAGVEVGAGDLDVERRRRAEIEDLADDIGGQERERRAGKRLRQLLAQASSHRRQSGSPLRSSVTSMSASKTPIVPEFRYEILMPLIGRPMLSTMLASRSGGMIVRIFCST